MLVISRKSQEFVQIGDNIIVKVIKTASGSVKIGIDAPGGIRVLRGELVLDDESLSSIWRESTVDLRDAESLAAV